VTHTITTVESTPTSITRECSCGWLTIGTLPKPDHHTPLEQREADHFREVAQIEDGTVWDEVPANHTYELFLRRRLSDRTPNHVVVRAVWWGGFREVAVWPWDAAGLAAAQDWVDRHGARWVHDGSAVRPGELVRLA
jgi:hypothetical protein